VLAAANPYTGPWTDYTTPVQFEWVPASNGNPPAIDPVLNAPVVNATTATFWLNLFKPNTTLTVYYGTAVPGTCNINNPQPPNCMQPFPNFGFLQMLNANYAYQSETTIDFPDQVAVGQGILNIYDATVEVTGLTPRTTYHWRSLTTDSLGNMAAYNDQVFTTLAQ